MKEDAIVLCEIDSAVAFSSRGKTTTKCQQSWFGFNSNGKYKILIADMVGTW